jgi:hypothetical protein
MLVTESFVMPRFIQHAFAIYYINMGNFNTKPFFKLAMPYTTNAFIADG